MSEQKTKGNTKPKGGRKNLGDEPYDFCKNLLAKSNGQTLESHLMGVAEACRDYLRNSHLGNCGYVVGIAHDLGKVQKYLQEIYLSNWSGPAGKEHSETGAAILLYIRRKEMEKLDNEKDKVIKSAMKRVYNIAITATMSHHGGVCDYEKALTVAKKRLGELEKSLECDGTKFPTSGEKNEGELLEKGRTIFLRLAGEKIHSAAKEIVEMETRLERIYEKSGMKKSSCKGIIRTFVVRAVCGALVWADRLNSRLCEDAVKKGGEYAYVLSEMHASRARREKWDELMEKTRSKVGQLSANTDPLEAKKCENLIFSSLSDEQIKGHEMRSDKRRIMYARNVLYGKTCEHGKKAGRGIYDLHLPTGLGKTLASLAWAILQARKHALRRIFYFIPFINVIQQNAGVIADTLGREEIVELHSACCDAEAAESDFSDLETACAGIADKRFPEKGFEWSHGNESVVLSTFVRLLDAFFRTDGTAAMRLASLSESVIVVDEIQALPVKFRVIVRSMLEFLQLLGCTILVTSATPFFRDSYTDETDDEVAGQIAHVVPYRYTRNFYIFCERTRVWIYRNTKFPEWVAEKAVELLDSRGSCILVANTTRQARKLAQIAGERLKTELSEDRDILVHISGRMISPEARKTLRMVEKRLEAGERILLICTKIVEAGADLSFAAGIRLFSGLDSIFQFAGRHNRHGEMKEFGELHVMCLNDVSSEKYLGELAVATSVARKTLAPILAMPSGSAVSSDAVEISVLPEYLERYFAELEKDSEYKSMSEYRTESGSLCGLCSVKDSYKTNLGTIGKEYSPFDDFGRESVVCLIDEDEENHDMHETSMKIRNMLREWSRKDGSNDKIDWRLVEQYVVRIPKRECEKLLENGMVEVLLKESNIKSPEGMENTFRTSVHITKQGVYKKGFGLFFDE